MQNWPPLPIMDERSKIHKDRFESFECYDLIFPRAKGKHFKEGQSDLSLFVTYFPFRDGRGGGLLLYGLTNQRGKIKTMSRTD